MYNTSKTLQKLMIDKDMTVSQLASACGLLQPSVSRALQKTDNDYRLSFLAQLLHGLGCSAEIVIKDSESGQVLYTIKEDEKSL